MVSRKQYLLLCSSEPEGIVRETGLTNGAVEMSDVNNIGYVSELWFRAVPDNTDRDVGVLILTWSSDR